MPSLEAAVKIIRNTGKVPLGAKDFRGTGLPVGSSCYGGTRESAIYADNLEPTRSTTSFQVTTTPSPTSPQFMTESHRTATEQSHHAKASKHKRQIAFVVVDRA